MDHVLPHPRGGDEEVGDLLADRRALVVNPPRVSPVARWHVVATSIGPWSGSRSARAKESHAQPPHHRAWV
ncbi:MAG: hypothetical protein WCG47_33810, partial [Dermatophilaceae bacterium]